MSWVELTIRTVSDGIELLCAELTEAGFDSFVIDDQEEFQEFLETSRDYWDYVDDGLCQKMQGLSQVRLYLPADEAERQLAELRTLLAGLPAQYPGCDFGPLTLSLENVPDEDWETSWMRSYRPLPVGERFLVVPQWMTVADMQGRLPVILDLGLTFGTGEHASTQMCMQTLETIVHGGERVADLGSGSGILSICALRLGAASAVGMDVDPAAEHIARENAARNGFGPDRFSACTGNVVTDTELMARLREGGGFDIVCANIVAGVIVQLVPVIPQLLKTGGRFLCSGILAEREAEVRQAIEAAGLHVIADRHTDEWCCLLAQ